MRYPHHTPGADCMLHNGKHPDDTDTIADAIMLTAEICGRPWSAPAARLLAQDLAGLEQDMVLAALARCRLELQGPLTMADILLRIEDGRPDAEEAWTMLPRDEAASVVWTSEMVLAWSTALPLLVAGDEAGAREAFTAVYRKAVLDARMRREPLRWIPSLGSDLSVRRQVLQDALKKQRLTQEHVRHLLPEADLPKASPIPLKNQEPALKNSDLTAYLYL